MNSINKLNGQFTYKATMKWTKWVGGLDSIVYFHKSSNKFKVPNIIGALVICRLYNQQGDMSTMNTVRPSCFYSMSIPYFSLTLTKRRSNNQYLEALKCEPSHRR